LKYYTGGRRAARGGICSPSLKILQFAWVFEEKKNPPPKFFHTKNPFLATTLTGGPRFEGPIFRGGFRSMILRFFPRNLSKLKKISVQF